ncbi:MAG: hypothetical protein ACJAZX_000309 [Rickettsiales bacterium]|jgi:hypothetical protein
MGIFSTVANAIYQTIIESYENKANNLLDELEANKEDRDKLAAVLEKLAGEDNKQLRDAVIKNLDDVINAINEQRGDEYFEPYIEFEITKDVVEAMKEDGADSKQIAQKFMAKKALKLGLDSLQKEAADAEKTPTQEVLHQLAESVKLLKDNILVLNPESETALNEVNEKTPEEIIEAYAKAATEALGKSREEINILSWGDIKESAKTIKSAIEAEAEALKNANELRGKLKQLEGAAKTVEREPDQAKLDALATQAKALKDNIVALKKDDEAILNEDGKPEKTSEEIIKAYASAAIDALALLHKETGDEAIGKDINSSVDLITKAIDAKTKTAEDAQAKKDAETKAEAEKARLKAETDAKAEEARLAAEKLPH